MTATPACFVFGLASLLAFGTASAADRFVAVTGSDVANDCLLSATPCRTIANALAQVAGGDAIKVALGTYSENLAIDAPGTVTISGGWTADFSAQDPAANATRVSGGGAGRVFDVAAGPGEVIDVTLDGLTIMRGLANEFAFGGGGVRAATSGDGALTLTITRSVLRNNRAVDVGGDSGGGGGIHASSAPPGSLDLNILDSLITKNVANTGGAIEIDGTVNAAMVNTTLQRNRLDSAGGDGGGAMKVRSSGGALSLVGCIVDRNRTGSLFTIDYFSSASSSLDITDSQMTRNRGGWVARIHSGGGVLTASMTNTIILNRGSSIGLSAVASNGGSLQLALTNTTLVQHRQKGFDVLNNDPGSTTVVDVSNTILWDNGPYDLQQSQVSGTLTVNADHNDIGVRVGTGTFNDLGGNISVDPLLEPGGPHLTAASPAIDVGTCSGAPATDFEGDPRPSGGGCDMGADEFVP